MNNIYSWSVWLHILASFLLPEEKDPAAMKTLLNIAGVTILPLMMSLLLLLVISVHMGIVAKWWLTGWWWLSIVIMIVMGVFTGTIYFFLASYIGSLRKFRYSWVILLNMVQAGNLTRSYNNVVWKG